MHTHFAEKIQRLDGLTGVGIGTKTSLMAALPELGQLTHAQIAKRVGVAPLNCDSGRHTGKRVNRGGRITVRLAVTRATLSAARFNLVACMHKLLTIIIAIMKSGNP